MIYVYFLLLANGNIYKGLTNNLERRVKEHESGKVPSTKAYLPTRLVGYEVYFERSDAERREKFLKTTEGRRLLQKQYRDAFIRGAEKD